MLRGVTRLLTGALLSVAVGVAALAGCSGADQAPGLADDGTWLGDGGRVPNRGPCQAWETRSCAIELGTHNGVVDCAQGTQICEGTTWGRCIPDSAKGITSVKAPPVLSVRRPTVGLQTVGGSSTTCTGDPCDPYCNIFNDIPDAAYQAETSRVTLDASRGPDLDNSNIPSGIANKGNDGTPCTPGCSTDACHQACQFDRRCSKTTAGKCEQFDPQETGSCVGVDLTVPTTCSVGNNDRNVTVCNRGTVAAPAGAKCYLFPGNSQHMPETNPIIDDATLIMTTQTSLAPGWCETQLIPAADFDSNGTEEVICNPHGFTIQPFTVTGNPRSNATVAGYGAWKTPERGYTSDGQYATAAPSDPAGARSAGPVLPATFADVGADEHWINPAEGLLADGVYASGSPGATATSYTVVKSPTADSQGLGAPAYTSDGAFGSVTVNKNKSSTITFGGFGFTNADVPATATITSVRASVVWKVGSAADLVTTSIQAYNGATGLGTAASAGPYNGNAPTSFVSLAQAVPGVTPAILTNNANFNVKVTVDNSGGSSLTADIDYVEVEATWNDGTTTATVAYGGFGFDSVVPPDATITSITVEASVFASVATTDATVSLQAYKGAGQTAIAGVSANRNAPGTAPAALSVTRANPGLTGADMTNASFAVRVKAVRSGPTAFTSYLDYVRVTVSYTVPHSTNLVEYGDFGFALPADAVVTQIVTEVKWLVTPASPTSVLGAGAYASGALVGTEMTTSPPPTTPTVQTQTLANPAVTPAAINDPSFKVRIRATR